MHERATALLLSINGSAIAALELAELHPQAAKLARRRSFQFEGKIPGCFQHDTSTIYLTARLAWSGTSSARDTKHSFAVEIVSILSLALTHLAGAATPDHALLEFLNTRAAELLRRSQTSA